MGAVSKSDLKQGLLSDVPPLDSSETSSPPAQTQLPARKSSIREFDSWISSSLHSSTANIKEARHFLVGLEHSGNGLLVIPATVLLFLNPWEGSAERRQFWLGLFIALLLDLAVIGVLKNFFRRPRPSYNRDMHLIVAVDKWSFPSGHSARAFLLACLVSMKACIFPETLTFPLGSHPVIPRATLVQIFDTWALATAASRIFLGRHYFFDVVCGGFCGYLEAMCTLHLLWPSIEHSEYLHQLLLQALTAVGLWH